MKKFCIFLLLLSCVTIFTAGCTVNSNKPNMIQSKRRFAEYVEPQGNVNVNVIDLSEGPKQNYNAQLGPQNLNFDFKIVDPY